MAALSPRMIRRFSATEACTPGLVSPSAPSSPGSARKQRANAQERLKEVMEKLAEAVEAIPVYASRLQERGPRGTIDFIITEGGVERKVSIGQPEYREFVKMVASELRKIPKFAGDLYKTRRRTSSLAGFNAPQRFVLELVDFFKEAELGPLVEGSFKLVTVGEDEEKVVVDKTTVRPDIQNRPLQSTLFFTMDKIENMDNPIYRIVSPGTLTALFYLHAYYANMGISGGYFSASETMRTKLVGVMQAAIDADAAKYKEIAPGQGAQIDALAARLKQAIDNRGLDIDSTIVIGGVEKTMFNPNKMVGAHFSKLTTAARVYKEVRIIEGREETIIGPPGLVQPGDQPFTDEERNRISPDIVRVYSRINFTQLNAENAFEFMICYQQRMASLAGAYKDVTKAAEARRKRLQEEQAKKAKRAARKAAREAAKAEQ